jgi:glycosyltransferase involved in cell wall biosynthesis
LARQFLDEEDEVTAEARTVETADGAGTAETARGAAPAATGPARASVVVPVRDEEASVGRLLEGLLAQSLRPAEIVVADGGSSDRTLEIVRRYAADSPAPVVLVEAGPALPGRGRNVAIRRASGEWVACIDAGIVPHPDWLKSLVEAAQADPEAEVVYGRYEAATGSYFEECAAVVYAPAPGERTRSIASCLLKRAAWERAGGFREDLRSGEDLLFFKRLDEAGARSVHAPAAVVYWSLQPTAAKTFRRFSTYSLNGMRAGLAREWQWRVTRFYLLLAATVAAGALWWWPLLVVPPLVLAARAARRVSRWRGGSLLKSLGPRRVLTVAWINLVIDAAMFAGMLRWLLARVRGA